MTHRVEMTDGRDVVRVPASATGAMSALGWTEVAPPKPVASEPKKSRQSRTAKK